MKLLDYTFYLMYRVLLKLGRVDWDAKMGITFLLGLWISFVLIGILSVFGFVGINMFILFNMIISKTIIWIGLFFLFVLLMYLRYYKFTDISTIRKSWKQLTKKQKTIYKVLSLFILITIPVLSFISFRMYYAGYIW
jgi:hypothetical protein